MGHNDLINHPGVTKRHPIGLTIYIQVEETQSYGKGETRQ